MGSSIRFPKPIFDELISGTLTWLLTKSGCLSGLGRALYRWCTCRIRLQKPAEWRQCLRDPRELPVASVPCGHPRSRQERPRPSEDENAWANESIGRQPSGMTNRRPTGIRSPGRTTHKPCHRRSRAGKRVERPLTIQCSVVKFSQPRVVSACLGLTGRPLACISFGPLEHKELAPRAGYISLLTDRDG